MFATEQKALSIARARSIALLGLSTESVDIDVHLSNGLPSFAIVGLPDKAVGESKERVRSALSSIGISIPPKKIVINLAPAALLKEGGHLDLPIAIGLLAVLGIIPHERASGCLALGELSLDGRIRAVPGVLPAAISAAEDRVELVCPAAQGGEAAWVSDEISIIAPQNLMELIQHFRDQAHLVQPRPSLPVDGGPQPDLVDVKGQESAKRALEVAAAGGHNVLMVGPPGSGKSMLATRLPGILPMLGAREVLEAGMIRSVSGEDRTTLLSRTRPFRSPHHAASMAAMVGGGLRAKPGEVSLAHQGVLFLDELPEFGRQVLEALRQPIETGSVSVARANMHVTYPAQFQLVAAMNPCRCGHLDDALLACNKAPRCAADYQRKISGPLFDRIDIHIEVPAVSLQDLSLPVPTEGSTEVRERVTASRQAQQQRFEALGRPDLATNSQAEGLVLDQLSEMSGRAKNLLETASQRLKLTARGYYRVLRVARTIADLDGADIIDRHHLAEAVAYRRRASIGAG